MNPRKDGRKVASITMKPELYEQLVGHCRELDIPVTIFAREAIVTALAKAQQ